MDSLTARILRCNPSRCDHCGGRLEHFETERYCPDCTSFTVAPQGPDWVDLGRLDDGDDLIDLARDH
jgi:hypothetical protein